MLVFLLLTVVVVGDMSNDCGLPAYLILTLARLSHGCSHEKFTLTYTLLLSTCTVYIHVRGYISEDSISHISVFVWPSFLIELLHVRDTVYTSRTNMFMQLLLL